MQSLWCRWFPIHGTSLWGWPCVCGRSGVRASIREPVGISVATDCWEGSALWFISQLDCRAVRGEGWPSITGRRCCLSLSLWPVITGARLNAHITQFMLFIWEAWAHQRAEELGFHMLLHHTGTCKCMHDQGQTASVWGIGIRPFTEKKKIKNTHRGDHKYLWNNQTFTVPVFVYECIYVKIISKWFNINFGFGLEIYGNMFHYQYPPSVHDFF